MKALGLFLLITLVLTSCQEDASQNDPNANFIRSNSGNNLNISDNTGGSDSDPTHAPIDGGLGILLVAGAAYGSRRLLKKKAPTT